MAYIRDLTVNPPPKLSLSESSVEGHHSNDDHDLGEHWEAATETKHVPERVRLPRVEDEVRQRDAGT